MSLELPQIFISSTGEFTLERRALEKKILDDRELGVVPYSYDAERPAGTSPLKECARRIRDSELVILVIGSKVGTLFPEPSGILAWIRRRLRGPEPLKSIVQWEYELARELGRPMHPYVKQFPAGTKIEELQEKFRGQITHFEKGTWSNIFETTDQFVERSYRDVRKWRFDFWELYRRLKATRVTWTRRVLLALTAFVCAALVTIALMALSMKLDRNTLSIVCAALIAALGILGYMLAKSGDVS